MTFFQESAFVMFEGAFGSTVVDAHLPLSRGLARILSFSRNTVAVVYKQLFVEGYKSGLAGIRVAKQPKCLYVSDDSHYATKLAQRIKRIGDRSPPTLVNE